MFPAPTTYLTANTHRMVLFHDQKIQADFARMEDIHADATQQVRNALEAIALLPYDSFKPIQRWADDFTKLVEKHRLLSEDFRHAAQSALRELAKLDPEAAPGVIDRTMRHLRNALEGSYRVTDLLAADFEITRYRIRQS
ncbi:hypothetical protein [Pseudooceanicola sp. 200-1SW]|uniref:hypothetical protein n=1 Tax=Pseudooceanicola sp. 200-1SW TaxID=3425949 RepID=UPI003D7F286B